MAKLDVRRVQTNPFLTDIVRQYRNESDAFIADKVSPRQSVPRETGLFYAYDDNDFFRTDIDLKRPDRSASKEIDTNFTTATFTCEEYAVRVSISDRERANADTQIQLQQSKLNLAMDQLMLAREARVAASLKAASGLASSTPANNWNVDAATIEADVATAKQSVFNATGRRPNTIVIPYQVAVQISVQQDIREILKYTVNGQQILALGEGILPKQIWGLQVLIPLGRSVTTREGQAVATPAEVWGDDVRVLYLSPGNVFGQPGVATTFSARDVSVSQWHDNDTSTDVYEVSEVIDERIVAPAAGYELIDLLS